MASDVYRPDAEDLKVSHVLPERELETCNSLLADRVALDNFYANNGYILLRGVLDPQSVAKARDAMLGVAVGLGIAVPGDVNGRATGVSFAGGVEESALYTGIARDLIKHPHNTTVMDQIVGEPACAVPIVQYRTYPPNGPVTTVHQDGFYSPGIQDYKPVWITLTRCTREMGGLALAVGQNRRGYFHNLAKPAPYPLPRDAIPDTAWATTDYNPGDVLVVHPSTPHCSMPNTSDRLRITFDTRVQSARNPSALAATVLSTTADSVTVEADGQGTLTLTVDRDTFIRVLSPARREPFEGFPDYTTPGMRLVVVRDGGRATMLRRLAEG
jgi:ectoine hydroxylase-related dioxygenase (phytanoyl-CoA dioxygenase family)